MQAGKSNISRRAFLKQIRWSPIVFLHAPLDRLSPRTFLAPAGYPFWASTEIRFTPHDPAKTPLEDIQRLVIPGEDGYVAEKYAFEIARVFSGWGDALKRSAPALEYLSTFLDAAMEARSLVPSEETPVSARYGIEVLRRRFQAGPMRGLQTWVADAARYFSAFRKVEVAEFEVIRIEQVASSPDVIEADIRYEIAGSTDAGREQRVGDWRTRWLHNPSAGWQAVVWYPGEEKLSRSRESIFKEVTSQALGPVPSYKSQLLRGADDWRTILDAATDIDIYGNNGVAAGDFDGDGFDDLYICQASGLPNRLYRNRGDGTLEDVTEQAGVGVLDATACALFADFENRGKQDLLVVCASGPLLFLNEGGGKFNWKEDAFRFAQPAQSAFTHAAVADYDGDGRLDVYFCVYSYYGGLDQYRYPVPYFDARNGPPNFLFHNEGNGIFTDRTQAAGLNVDNDRYSFACAWGDAQGAGRPDLYVANDFGRGNLYRNNGDGTFTSVAREAGVDQVGAGMSACWFDFDRDGKQDIYVGNMWSAAGIRVSEQKLFHETEPESIRALYRRHARGNSLFQNQGDGNFKNMASQAGVEMGRWSWSSDAWDFDQDGYPDLYVANGWVSGPNSPELASFFWRQVVAKSPQTAAPSPAYETGWNAINELIRSDGCWNGHERNVFYSNNHDGTFSDISAVAGLDLPDDSRAFALADLDGDGRLEFVLKNRNAPQVRILRNVMKEVGNSVVLRLRGTKSNRDGIGSRVTVESGPDRQTKYLQAGSGFLSQHSKELFFGLGETAGTVRATVRWPSGASQTFEGLPVNHRIEIEEGAAKFVARPYGESRWMGNAGEQSVAFEKLPATIETWLVEPLAAPNFALPDAAGTIWELRKFPSAFLLLTFWTVASEQEARQLSILREQHSGLRSRIRLAAVNIDAAENQKAVGSFLVREAFPFPVLLGTPQTAGIYNIIYRYLFDRHRDLAPPVSFLLDREKQIVKIYQGPLAVESLGEDLDRFPQSAVERVRLSLPFPGQLCFGTFERNDLTYGVALFEHGYLDQAADAFQQVIARKPQSPGAFYNLGTLYLRQNRPLDARGNLEKALKLRPDYPEAWNNLGLLAAQEGNTDEAIQNFKQALALRPEYAVALANLGNIHRRQKSFRQAEELLGRAVELEPNDPEINYSLGMLYAQQGEGKSAELYLRKALSLRPDYPDALNNLGVLFAGQRRYAEAEGQFQACIQSAPHFARAYLNLARLYVVLNDREKAKGVLESLLRLEPQNAMAKQTLETLN
jgi:Tfp pilus assembly protein PilF